MDDAWSPTFRLISWNVQKEKNRNLGRQVAELSKRRPDIVALQEVRENFLGLCTTEWKKIGFDYVEDSYHAVGGHSRGDLQSHFQVIGSRWPLRLITQPVFFIPWPESVLSVFCDSPWGQIEIHTVHVPNGSTYEQKKPATFHGIYRRLAQTVAHSRILCGDFNSPQEEHHNGQIVTWGQHPTKNRGGLGGQWDRDERSALLGLADHGLPDVFRLLNGYQVEEYSYYIGVSRRRYDHIFASRALNPIECLYLRNLGPKGEQPLSDHAPIEALFHPEP